MVSARNLHRVGTRQAKHQFLTNTHLEQNLHLDGRNHHILERWHFTLGGERGRVAEEKGQLVPMARRPYIQEILYTPFTQVCHSLQGKLHP